MYAELEDFKTGWYGLSLGLRKEEIGILIELLANLKDNSDQHFHLASNYDGTGGIGDIEFYIQEEGNHNNMVILGDAIEPT